MFITTAAILLLPESLAQSLHLEFLTTEYRRYVSLGLVVSGAVLAVIMGQQFRPLVYTDRQGRTLVPDEPYEESVLSEGAFQFPAWGRVDWKDVFNGDDASGRWGICYASTR